MQGYIAKGCLRRVLADWCPPYSGYHLLYPNRRQSSAAFALVVEALTGMSVFRVSFCVCACRGPVLACTCTCFFYGALPQHIRVL